jgi:hypothetical protein
MYYFAKWEIRDVFGKKSQVFGRIVTWLMEGGIGN